MTQPHEPTPAPDDARDDGPRQPAGIDHLPGVKVSGQPQGGAVDRAHERDARK